MRCCEKLCGGEFGGGEMWDQEAGWVGSCEGGSPEQSGNGSSCTRVGKETARTAAALEDSGVVEVAVTRQMARGICNGASGRPMRLRDAEYERWRARRGTCTCVCYGKYGKTLKGKVIFASCVVSFGCG